MHLDTKIPSFMFLLNQFYTKNAKLKYEVFKLLYFDWSRTILSDNDGGKMGYFSCHLRPIPIITSIKRAEGEDAHESGV